MLDPARQGHGQDALPARRHKDVPSGGPRCARNRAKPEPSDNMDELSHPLLVPLQYLFHLRLQGAQGLIGRFHAGERGAEFRLHRLREQNIIR